MNRNDWIRTLLSRGNFPLGPMDEIGVPCSVVAGVTWIESEGSNARNNPLDTEQPWPGSTNYNSVGVKNYATTVDGFNATLATLHNGYYGHLVAVLQNPLNAEEIIQAIYNSPWGSKPTEAMLTNVRNHWAAYADAYVSGTGQTPLPGQPPITNTEESMFVVPTPSGNGYWEVKPADGSVYAYGDAFYFGGLNNTNGKNVMVAGDVVTDVAAHPTSQGYWIITAHGRMYAYGASRDFGSVA